MDSDQKVRVKSLLLFCGVTLISTGYMIIRGEGLLWHKGKERENNASF